MTSREQSSDELFALQAWYASQCDGNWEHQYGVRIGTLDNPGWSLDIDISETRLVDRPFVAVAMTRSEGDWVHCEVDGAVFKARGGVRNLREMLRLFLAWAHDA